MCSVSGQAVSSWREPGPMFTIIAILCRISQITWWLLLTCLSTLKMMNCSRVTDSDWWLSCPGTRCCGRCSCTRCSWVTTPWGCPPSPPTPGTGETPWSPPGRRLTPSLWAPWSHGLRLSCCHCYCASLCPRDCPTLIARTRGGLRTETWGCWPRAPGPRRPRTRGRR